MDLKLADVGKGETDPEVLEIEAPYHDAQVESDKSEAEVSFAIGQNIRCMRELRGWSQLELARRAELSRTTIRRIEEGLPCWPATLKRLAKTFNLPVHEFIETGRFHNVLEPHKPYVVHDASLSRWNPRGDRRTSVPEKNIELIQSANERSRLGHLGFVPAFIAGLEFHLPVGPGIFQMEIYGRHTQRYMPQFAALAMYVLENSVLVTIDGEQEKLEVGCAIAFESTKVVTVEPAEEITNGNPCRVLLIGSQRQKLP